MDLNICDAWNVTEVNGVDVAVLDQGIELTHNDLYNNISQNSYDTESVFSSNQVFGNHRIHMAGTIAVVKNNNLQVGCSCSSSNINMSQQFSFGHSK